MQRTSAPADFSSILNPSSTSSTSSISPTLQDSQPALLSPTTNTDSTPSSDTEMAAAAVGLPPAAMPSTGNSSDEQRQDLPRPYKCPLCDKAFHRLEHQTRHIRTHTGEKPHACQFPGCSKRFSRSDELTRHSRIHNNPNSRRGNKAQNAAAAAAAAAIANGSLPEGQVVVGGPQYSGARPGSNLASPNVSPPHSYSSYPASQSSLNAYNRSGGGTPNGASDITRPLDINLLATAASQVERETQSANNFYPPQRSSLGTSSHSHHHHHHHGHRSHHNHGHHHHPYNHHGSGTGNTRLPSLQAYAYSSHSMSRSHSHEDHDDYARGHHKRSRPASPQSTAPNSPTWSCDSCSPTPGHTPAITPAHSPRIRPSDCHLPGIRHLSLQHMMPAPALEPLEPATESNFYLQQSAYSMSRSNSGPRISDIIGRTDGTQRKLPVPTPPKFAVQDLLNADGMLSSSNGSHHWDHSGPPSGTISPGEPMDRDDR